MCPVNLSGKRGLKGCSMHYPTGATIPWKRTRPLKLTVSFLLSNNAPQFLRLASCGLSQRLSEPRTPPFFFFLHSPFTYRICARDGKSRSRPQGVGNPPASEGWLGEVRREKE